MTGVAQELLCSQYSTEQFSLICQLIRRLAFTQDLTNRFHLVVCVCVCVLWSRTGGDVLNIPLFFTFFASWRHSCVYIFVANSSMPIKTQGLHRSLYKVLYYVSQLVRALWLVNLAGRILLYGPLNLKVSFPVRPINLRDITNILLTSFSRSVVSSVVSDPRFFPLIYKRTGKNSVRNLQYGPRTQLTRGIHFALGVAARQTNFRSTNRCERFIIIIRGKIHRVPHSEEIYDPTKWSVEIPGCDV